MTVESPIPVPAARRELARRHSGGIEVTLYWAADDDSTSIEIWQPATDERLTVIVAGEHALDAFYHPFAHLHAATGIDAGEPVSSAAWQVNDTTERTS